MDIHNLHSGKQRYAADCLGYCDYDLGFVRAVPALSVGGETADITVIHLYNKAGTVHPTDPLCCG